ncbi:LacI family DNA-binding transcriptional regulator [Arthrobacter sp. ISL-95]|uniref:LacI family DNA-binding transcriptional regulator n=1 Tax=Arthrobacter sp. ISL-95 TaxID=2819116 RepID=UPI001BE91CEB|nr:LacI family DNA-binding transcriptional regulator [Arthrobacter sp. ISL-95]MBT2588445.1 LacI family DNA-binding transcriptional regulator [Arthrobacter sp. ISL-95]
MTATASPLSESPVMKDVARFAGVSHQTVSRVINDLPHVSADARQRVERAIHELGYQPNTLARDLRQRTPRTIGVLTTRWTGYGPMQAILGAEKAAKKAGYSVSLSALAAHTLTNIQSAVENFASQPVVGIIVLTPHHCVVAALEQIDVRIPIIAAGCASNGVTLSINSRQRLGARLAVQHLLAQGHTRIGHLSGPPGWTDSAERRAGWQEALDEAGLEAETLLWGDWSARSGYDASAKLVSDGTVTAMFAANDQMALGLLRGIHESGKKVPAEMGIVGYGDQPEAAYFSPPLSTVRQDFEALGSLCVDALLNEESAKLRAVSTPDPVLVIRNTSARLPDLAGSLDTRV